MYYPFGSVGRMIQESQAAQAAAQPNPAARSTISSPSRNPNVVSTTTNYRPSPAAVAGLRRGFRF